VGRIAFDPVFTKAMVQGETLPEYAPQADATRQVKEIWQQIITSEAMIH
jgi:MinD-like ATPase involved in chromosome partitioning or flagellar assembly